MLDVNIETIVSDLSDMVRIPSVNPFGATLRLGFGEEDMATYYERRLADLGLETGTHEVSTGRRNCGER